MSDPRICLYQYAHSPFCIPIALILEHGQIPHEIVDVPLCDPRQILELTHGQYYQAPVIADLVTREVLWESGPESSDIARYLAALATELHLFPEDRHGLQDLLTRYIENDLEAVGFKICDSEHELWLKNEVERGLLRRHKERKFGLGCLEEWKKNQPALIQRFHQLLAPLDHMLGNDPFLLGENPTYADYALYGVITNFLYPKTTRLDDGFINTAAWYARMKNGQFPNLLNSIQLAAKEQFGAQSEHYGKGHILENVDDVKKAISDLKIRPGRKALDIACGTGHTGLHLASTGLDVTLCDISPEMLERAREQAEERGLKVTLNEHTAEKLPYPDQSFDLVTCRVAAHHFSNPQAFLAEAARVLKVYGYLLIIDGTVSDDQPEAENWLHQVEKLRDPSHHRFIRPRQWKEWTEANNLRVVKSMIEPLKMPDLQWYFTAADTSPENRKKVLELVSRAPQSARDLFKISVEEGKIVWWWQRLTFLAGKL
jgi:2-polyprenyl-3-methyl-5-hydroxy-6-metoxy-1,4-benzoquinol methylase